MSSMVMAIVMLFLRHRLRHNAQPVTENQFAAFVPGSCQRRACGKQKGKKQDVRPAGKSAFAAQCGYQRPEGENNKQCCRAQSPFPVVEHGQVLRDRQVVDGFARVLKALGSPVRLKIMHILGRSGGQVCVCDIEAQFDLSQPTISHHLRLLREAGLVETEQRGPWVHYSVRRGEIDALARHVAHLAD